MLNLKSLIFLISFVFLALPPIFTKSTTSTENFFLGLSFYKIFIRVAIAAIYEEVFYRVYFPVACKNFLAHNNDFFGLHNSLTANRQNLKFLELSNIKFFAESFSILLFALAHKYLGFFAVVYAFVVGVFFRFIFCSFQNKILAFLLIVSLHIMNNLVVVFYL